MKKQFLLLALMTSFITLNLCAQNFLQRFDKVFTSRTYDDSSRTYDDSRENRSHVREIKKRISYSDLSKKIRIRLKERDAVDSFLDCELDCYVEIQFFLLNN